MGVHFVIGRAATGKSQGCFSAIVRMLRADPLGDPIYWIVPKQETFTTERLLTCGSGLSGFCRARIVSFELLGEDILAECGGTAIPQITELVRQMIIGHLLRQHQSKLVHYASAARQVGLAAELDATFAELERCGKSSRDLDALIEGLTNTPGAADVTPLVEKLTDLRLLYQSYTTYLGQERLDPHRRLQQVLGSIENCRAIQGTTVFVDGFLEFTDYERQMLAGLAKACREMHITLLMDPDSPLLKDPHRIPDELSLFHRTEDAFRRLWFIFHETGVEMQVRTLRQPHGFENEALRQLERHLFEPRPTVCSDASGIELIEAPDRRAEIDAAARQIKTWLEQGLRLRDIVVLMRNLEDYHELIDASFREHEIPYFVDRRRTAGHHPLLQLTRSALQIALHGWPHDAVMALLKTELTGLTRDEVDALENYVLLHRIKGPIWESSQPWTFQRKLTRSVTDEMMPSYCGEAAEMDRLRATIAERMRPLIRLFLERTPVPVRQLVEALFRLFESFAVRDSLKQWIAQATGDKRLEEAGEHEQVWASLVDLLDEMVDVLGDERVLPADFVDVLETGLERFDLALTPPTLDQVLVGSVDRTRSPRVRAAIVLGLNDTQFPRIPREGSILSDRERQALRKHSVQLDPDTERALLDEWLLGYIGLTRASRQLCLTRSLADDEARPQAPSPFWNRVRAQFPALEPRRIPRQSKAQIDCIGTPRQLVTSLMHWVRHGGPDEFASLYHWLATHECTSDAIDIMRFRAWRALRYINEAKLSKMLFASPLRASVSQIETFATCPFKHFMSYGLRLSQREQQDVTAIDLGIACHQILEKLVKGMLLEQADWQSQKPEQTAARISALAKQIGQDLRGDLMLSSHRNQYLLKRLEKTLGHVVAAQTAAAGRGSFAPWRAELEFGEGKTIPELALTTPGGNVVKLRGKIDRVDLLEDQAIFAVVDYKYRGDKLALDHVWHGLSLQLLTYLIVIERSGAVLAGKPLTPAAAFYVKLLRQLEPVGHPDEAIEPDDPLFHLAEKPRGIINWNHRAKFDGQWESGSSEVVQLHITRNGAMGKKNTCDGCESEEFTAMLHLAERKLGELADQIVAGVVDVAPYRIGQVSPCAWCEYRSVCRFDPALNTYRYLEPMKREQVLERAMEQMK